MLAAQFEKFKGFQTTSGKITYSKTVHGVTGRAYRVMVVNNNKAKFLRFWKTKKLGEGYRLNGLAQAATPDEERWPGGALRATAVSRSFAGVDALAT